MRHGFDCSPTFESLSVFPKTPDELSPAREVQNHAAMSLREILPMAEYVASEDIEFEEVAEAHGAIAEGQLAVYRIGDNCPNRVIADAMARGAVGILTEQLLPCPLPQCVVGDIELALAEIRARQLDTPDRRMLTIGVMGAAGKTTVTLLISSLLRASGIRTAYACDLGDSDGVIQATPDHGLPVGSRLIEHLADSADAGSQAAIVEVDEAEARHGRYDSMQFDILVIAGEASGCSDFGPSGLQCMLERLTPEGVAIAPSKDSRACRVILENECQLLTYGIGHGSDVSTRVVQQAGGITTLLITHQNVTAAMETTLCGEAMAANHAAAAMVGLLLALPLENIAERLGTLREIPGRRQHLADLSRATIVVDAGGSPDRVATTLRDYRRMETTGGLWCILALDDSMSDEELAQYGNVLEKHSDHALVTSRKESQSTFLQRSHFVLDGVTKCAAFRLVANQRRAVEWVLAEAKPTDTVVVVTSQSGQSAHSQRHEVERLKRWLDPPQLKIFK